MLFPKCLIPIPNFEMNKLFTKSFHQFPITNSQFFFSITWHDPTCPGFRSSQQWEPWWNSTLCKKCHFATDAKAYTQSNSYHQNDEKIVKKHQCARWPFRSNSFYAGSHVLQCAQVQVQVRKFQIILRLFLVCHLLQQTKSVFSQPASNVRGLVIHWTGLIVHSDD